MVVALIVVGVVVFLAVDTLIVYRVFRSRASADAYGMFMVPGETSVTVPAGKLKISYQEEYRAGSTTEDDIEFGVPGQLQVTVMDAEGNPVEIKGPGYRGMGSSLNVGSGWSRALVGTVQVAERGSYTVKAEPAIEGGVEPKILIGK